MAGTHYSETCDIQRHTKPYKMMLVMAFMLECCLSQPSAPTRLRVEYLKTPITVDIPEPRFSWALHHSERNSFQTAYHIVVTEVARGGESVAWDSGIISSNQTTNVPYGSNSASTVAALQSDSDYEWSVSWVDQNGEESQATQSTFSTGIMRTSSNHNEGSETSAD